MTNPNAPQPPPAPRPESEAVWPHAIRQIRSQFAGQPAAMLLGVEMLIRDCMERDKQGTEKYGVPLAAGNGRDCAIDAYQEAMDLCAYLAQGALENRWGWELFNSAVMLALEVKAATLSIDRKANPWRTPIEKFSPAARAVEPVTAREYELTRKAFVRATEDFDDELKKRG